MSLYFNVYFAICDYINVNLNEMINSIPSSHLVTFHFLSDYIWVVATIVDMQVKGLVIKVGTSWHLENVNGTEFLNFSKIKESSGCDSHFLIIERLISKI